MVQKFSDIISEFGFLQSSAHHSLFTTGSGTSLVILLVYVDDIILAGPNIARIRVIQSLLEKRFKLKI